MIKGSSLKIDQNVQALGGTSKKKISNLGEFSPPGKGHRPGSYKNVRHVLSLVSTAKLAIAGVGCQMNHSVEVSEIIYTPNISLVTGPVPWPSVNQVSGISKVI